MEKVKDIFRREAEAIKNIPVNGFYEDVVDAIYERVHIQKGKVITSGMGKAGQIAHNIATTLSSTGTPAIFLHPSEAQHGDLGVIQKSDILLCISNSGKTREILELLDLKASLYDKIPVIVITSDPESELAHRSDFLLLTGNPDEVCILGLTPTTSTTVMTVIGDAIVVLLEEKIGFTRMDYAKRHHGGYLGKKSRDEH
ncbi:MAG: SIS domain-containing protein [Bacteroidales bacterium]|nr:SIS domain-containing protein [Bacteroidales bacterium]